MQYRCSLSVLMVLLAPSIVSASESSLAPHSNQIMTLDEYNQMLDPEIENTTMSTETQTTTTETRVLQPVPEKAAIPSPVQNKSENDIQESVQAKTTPDLTPQSVLPADFKPVVSDDPEPAPVVKNRNGVFSLAVVDTGKRGYNASNPTWSPDGLLMSFDRADNTSREIIIINQSGKTVRSISFQVDEEMAGLELLLPELSSGSHYSTSISWAPNSSDFVYMSNGSEGNYDLYRGNIHSEDVVRLTEHAEKDGHPKWSPAADEVIFVSGRTGNADLFLMDLKTRALSQVTKTRHSSLYPEWSPDGSEIAFTWGSNQNHEIAIVDPKKQTRKPDLLVKTRYDDVRPIWSPDGSKIAFYTNAGDDPKNWSIAVIPVDKKRKTIKNIEPFIVARNIIPNMDKGPGWSENSQSIVYIKKDEKNFNPIHVLNLSTGKDKMLETDTRINNDISVGKGNRLAFRSQLNQWDTIFQARIEE